VPAPENRTAGLAQASAGSGRPAEELDAADETDRELIAVLEASARMVPQQRFPAYLAVTRQLWDDDPSGVWEAAQRMRAAGRSRDAVLDKLARAWERAGADDERYAAALRKLR
jgi:hypothetical protein